jgi:hypothetical protein
MLDDPKPEDPLLTTVGDWNKARQDAYNMGVSDQKSKEHQACPCLHTTPCHDNCTCVNGWSSSGCLRCCSYGSSEQRKAHAEYLVKREEQLKQAEIIIKGFMASDDNCGVDGCTNTSLGGFLAMQCKEHIGEDPMFEQSETFAKIVHDAREWLKETTK